MYKVTKTKKREQKLRVFKFLHNPNTKWSHVYHSFVITFVCTYAIMQNFYLSFDEFKDNYEENLSKNKPVIMRSIFNNTESVDYFVMSVDASLSCFFIIEMFLRLWSSTYIVVYSGGLRGWIEYLKAYRYRRLLDLLGILFYVLSFVVQLCHFNEKWRTMICIVQILQIWQANRILYTYMRVIFRTIFGFQSHYLLFCLFLIFMMITLSSAVIFLTECNAQNTDVFNIFQSFWLMQSTFSTIGYVTEEVSIYILLLEFINLPTKYGDVVPKHWFSKFIVCLLSVVGIFVFSLPSNIIGTTLSIKMNQDSRKSMKYRKAVRLIQAVWRCRISNFKKHNGKHNCSVLCGSLTNPNSLMYNPKESSCNAKVSFATKWTERDLMIIWFIMKTKYIMARYRLKRHNINMASYRDVSQQNDEMWHRLDYIEKDLSLLSAAIYEQLNQRLVAIRGAIVSINPEIELLRKFYLVREN